MNVRLMFSIRVEPLFTTRPYIHPLIHKSAPIGAFFVSYNAPRYTANIMVSESSSVPALEIIGLKKTYAGTKKKPGTEALKGVSLTVPQGEFFAFLGPNGAGKTSLISIVSGLATKNEGQVQIHGISIDEHPDHAKAFIGLVPQELNFNIFEKVIDIVLDQAGYYGITRAEALPHAEQVLKDLSLWEKRNDMAQHLSGGMKRRLLIARALVHKPRVLLLDEPTAGVDVELRRGMWDFLRELNAAGTTIILTTHYLEEAEQLCRRVAIINQGEIVKEGSVKGLLSSLNTATLLVDTKDPLKLADMELLRGYPITKMDDTTLEVKLEHKQSANDAFRKISSIGIEIMNVRNTGSRLEEVFVNLTEKK
ncbi:MAG: ABC-2 type transport system ATP-binding protein [Parcubacteria bacterium C7867-007]|nr:MAG: ABC-2 type transport system ATP-binding protein [Parcubacteria bacterium C7867-007]